MRAIQSVLLVLLACGTAAAKYYEAKRYDSFLNLDSQGVLTVSETVVFHFVDGPFTFVFREIATTETDGIDQVEASIDGQRCISGTGPGQVEIKGRSPVVVRWHFAPMITGAHTFTVRYRVRGAIRTAADGSQSLVWRALPPTRSYPIDASDIVLAYPSAVQPRSVELRSGGPPFRMESGRAEVNLSDSPAGANVIVSARFAAGSFTGPQPLWLSEQEHMSEAQRQGGRLGGWVAPLLLAAALIWMFRTRLSAMPVTGGYRAPIAAPPDSLAPALAAWITGRGTGSLGTLLDLANRGVLRIEETPGTWGSRRFQVVRLATSQTLAPHEAVLMELAFRTGETSIRLQNFFSRQMGRLPTAIRRELEAAGMVDAERAAARRKLLIAGALGIAASILLILFGAAGLASGSAPMAGVLALLVGASLGFSAMLSLILGATQSIWSERGMAESVQWKAYAAYLTSVSRGAAPLPGPAEMQRILPYAGAFGLMARLLKLQSKQHGIAPPAWFHAMQSATSNGDAFLAFSSACASSSEAGGAGGGGGGGGGASGGGSSGAG